MTVACPHPPFWFDADQLHPALAEGVTDWLFDTGSLSRRLTALSGGTFGVSVLDEGWRPLHHDECANLEVARGSQGWVREVCLFGQEQPWIFARSVASRSHLEEGLDLGLDSLGNRPLGELLFDERTAFQRGAIQVARCPADWLPPALRNEGLWCRRSCFQRDALGVLVMEVFLPALWERARIAPGGL